MSPITRGTIESTYENIKEHIAIIRYKMSGSKVKYIANRLKRNCKRARKQDGLGTGESRSTFNY